MTIKGPSECWGESVLCMCFGEGGRSRAWEKEEQEGGGVLMDGICIISQISEGFIGSLCLLGRF